MISHHGLSWSVVILGIVDVIHAVQVVDARGLNCTNAVSGYHCESVNFPSKSYFYMDCPSNSSISKKRPFSCSGTKVCLQEEGSVRCVEIPEFETVRTKPNPRVTSSTTAPPPPRRNSANGRPFNCSRTKSGFYCLNNKDFVRVVCPNTVARVSTYKFSCRKGTSCVQFTDTFIQCRHNTLGGIKTSGGDSGKPLSTKKPVEAAKSLVKISRNKTPMFVYFSIDDGITPGVFDSSLQLFKNRKNPNNCTVTATYNVVQVNTVFKLLKELHNDYGHEINSHGTTHRSPSSWWRNASKAEWEDEVVGITRIVEEKTGISSTEVKGMRAPFLEVGGNHVFEMLFENGFSYDTSLVPRAKLYWPYLIENMKDHPGRCANVHGCPTKDFPLWEVPLNKYYDCPVPGFEKVGLAMLDQCQPSNQEDSLKYLKKNFYRFYSSKEKVPFGLNMHFAWFAGPHRNHNLKAMTEFLDEIQQLPDVWIVSSYKILQWMENQVTHEEMKKGKFSPVNC